MPEKSERERAARAKARGTPMSVKESDRGTPEGASPHAMKKSSHVIGERQFADREVSHKAVPGHGLTHEGQKLPLSDRPGSTTSRHDSLPSEAAALHRKDE